MSQCVSLTHVYAGTVQITGLLPSNEWKRQALSTIFHYSGTKRRPVNKINNPDPIQPIECEDIIPHTRDAISGKNGSCLIAALAKEITGTEQNHRSVRLAIVNYMSEHPELHEALGLGSIQAYLAHSKMANLGTWGTDIKILTVATMLNMEVIVSCVLPGQPRVLAPFCPITVVQYETPSGRQRASSQQVQDPNRVKVYLYHNDCRNHYDRIVPYL